MSHLGYFLNFKAFVANETAPKNHYIYSP